MPAPPPLPGSPPDPSPIDKAIALAARGERDAALGAVTSYVESDPASPTGLVLLGRLLSELGQEAEAKLALATAATRAIDAGLFALAVVAASSHKRLDPSATPHAEIARAFAKGSRRYTEGQAPPPRMRSVAPPAPAAGGVERAGKAVAAAARALEEAKASRATAPRLAAPPLFSTISEAPLARLLEAFEVRAFDAGARIIEQGAPGAEAFVLARGELEVAREQEDRPPISLARLQPGAIFGEMALLSRAPRAASVVATRPGFVLVAGRAALDKVAESERSVATELAAFTRRRMLQNLERTSAVLSAVSSAQRPALFERFVARTFEKGHKLIEQGAEAAGLFVIASGEVAAIRQDGDESLVLATLGPGDTAGEVALVLRRAANADVVATHPTVALFLPKESFLGLIKEHPVLLAELYAVAIQRDDETSQIVGGDTEEMTVDDFVVV
ncbi:MAG: cyclic nucleotide-binding domain-containing protein [Polyangiaceae bacterium]|nr:cyclic nucleotide-binding domain-containing protein [Polyangiaceae bacterium]